MAVEDVDLNGGGNTVVAAQKAIGGLNVAVVMWVEDEEKEFAEREK
ncbi:hypothetical protein L195_g001568 [Trifolium pratense]|uniref:Uncharacterized protein n=1 Tax=Trifolium pratense TaxID=57577 RepID=A0A2K3NQ19_TRIPR|nr:hypothetical protein L195_g001568 [Trifolium pratense]